MASKPWTQEEDRTVIIGAQEGRTNAEIADLLPNRTVAAVRCRRPLLTDSIRSPASGLSKPQMAEAVYQYTHQGLGKTAQQVANTLGVPVQALKSEFRARGITKHSPPVLPEDIPDDPSQQEKLAEEISAKRSADFSKRLDEVDANKLRRENRKLRAELEDADRPLRLFEKRLENVEVPTIPSMALQWLGEEYRDYIAPTADPHFGKRVWGRESWGENYDTKIAEQRYKDAADWMAERIASDERYRCRNLYLPSLGDVFHAPLLETEHGTPLEQDGRDLYVIDSYMSARHHQIARAREVSEHVHVYGVPGNHGHLIEQLALRELAAYYRDADDVTVHAGVKRYAHFRVGTTAWILDHGYGINKLDTPSTEVKLDRLARAELGDGYRMAEYTYFLVGHLHSQGLAEYGSHAQVLRLRAMCEVDDYETGKKYDGNAGVSLFRLSEEGRIDGTERLRL